MNERSSPEIVELLERAEEYLGTITNKGNCGPHHLVSDLAAALRASQPATPIAPAYPDRIVAHEDCLNCSCSEDELCLGTQARRKPEPATPTGGEVDLTNHHNALKCPYCNPQCLEFAPARSSAGSATAEFDVREFEEDAFRSMEVQICGETRTVQFTTSDHGGDHPTSPSVAIDWDEAIGLADWIISRTGAGPQTVEVTDEMVERAEAAFYEMQEGPLQFTKGMRAALAAALRSSGAAQQAGWCQPMENGKHAPRKFILYFEDRDQQMVVFDDEAEARAAFAKADTNWNCYLFGALAHSSTERMSPNPAGPKCLCCDEQAVPNDGDECEYCRTTYAVSSPERNNG